MTVNGIDLHEWAIEEVATQLCMSAVAVRDQLERGAAVMQAAVHFAELYGAKIERVAAGL